MSMVFHSCIDQGCPHVMCCQIEPLIILKKILGIALLINRFSLLDEQIHIVPEADETLDCAAWEIYNRPITTYIFLK